MTGKRLATPLECDDDVAGLFMKLGDGKGRPEYRDFSEVALPQPVVAARPAATMDVPEVRHPHGPVPAPTTTALPPDTPLSQLFRRLAETGGAVPDDSPLIHLRKQ